MFHLILAGLWVFLAVLFLAWPWLGLPPFRCRARLALPGPGPVQLRALVGASAEPDQPTAAPLAATP